MEKAKVIKYLNELKASSPSDLFINMKDQEKGKCFVLKYLSERGEVNPNELAEQLGVSTARIAKILNKLEEENLIERNSSLEDARKKIVSLTEKGKEENEKNVSEFLEVISFIMDEIGEENIKKMIELSQITKNAVSKYIDKKKGEQDVKII